MALQIDVATRKFKFKNNELPDINPGFSPQEIMEAYAGTHPELTTGSVEGPEIDDEGTATYTFKTVSGKFG